VVLVVSLTHRLRASDPWDACCLLRIVNDDAAGPTARKTIVGWQRETLFTGRGFAGEPVDSPQGPFESWKRRQIGAGIADFMEHHLDAQIEDYFRSLGMTCALLGGTKDVTRCAIELPIAIQCRMLAPDLEGHVPLPEQLRGRIPAFLQVSIDSSKAGFERQYLGDWIAFRVSIAPAVAFIATKSQVFSVPGGRLCHR
jgi:hypothetical protein